MRLAIFPQAVDCVSSGSQKATTSKTTSSFTAYYQGSYPCLLPRCPHLSVSLRRSGPPGFPYLWLTIGRAWIGPAWGRLVLLRPVSLRLHLRLLGPAGTEVITPPFPAECLPTRRAFTAWLHQARPVQCRCKESGPVQFQGWTSQTSWNRRTQANSSGHLMKGHVPHFELATLY